MNKNQFKTTINAPREKVWQVLWNDDTYKEWTLVFSPNGEPSMAKTDWTKGGKVLFLDGSGKNGMVARIVDNVPNQFMAIEHQGEVINGVEDTTSDRVKNWAGAREDYTLKTVDGQTELTVDMDLNSEYEEMFKDLFPKALAKVKEIAERN